MTFVSVVIPAYNEEKYLGRCLQSLRGQRHPASRFEVIVVDNASTDATAEIAGRFGARVVPEPRKGVARARQAGFLEARGPVIASTDADTVLPPDWLSRIAKHFSDPNLGGVYGPVHWFDGSRHQQWALRYPVTWGLIMSNQVGRSLWWGSNFAVRQDVFWRAGGFPVDWLAGEDTDLSLRVNRIARVRFDRQLVVLASSRRMGEGWGLLRRSAVGIPRRFLAGGPPVPLPDIR